MAFEKKKNEHNLPVQVSTDVGPRQFLTPGGTSVLLAVPVGTNSARPYWHSGLGTTASGAQLPADEPNQIVKAVAGASCGVGVEVFIGSSNGILMPAVVASLFSASGHWITGVTMSPAAAAGEIFSIDFRPRKA